MTILLLAGTTLFLRDRSRHEVMPPRVKLAALPHRLGSWFGTDISVSREVLDVLGPGDFLLRDYRDSVLDDPLVNLFVAYFPSQRAGDSIHSPKNCLPGAGWLPIESDRVQISLPGRDPFPVNRYLVEKGPDRALLIYWYLSHDRIVASEYVSRFYLVKDSLEKNRSDGSLIRLGTQLRHGESSADGERRIISLATNLVPELQTYIPR